VRRLQATWERQLSAVTIAGGSTERQRAFYTALYHAQLHPNLAGDVDGRYAGFDGKTHTASGFTPYQNLSLWDTHRPQNQLLHMLQPKVARDVALSVVAIGRNGGWLPRWSLANSETNIMTGDPVTPFLVETWSKGLLEGHEKEAYTLLRKNALSTPPDDSPCNGRAGVDAYQKRGYIPSGLEPGTDCPDKGGDNDCRHPASATLEYAAADASLALMAKGLGRTADARMFAARGQWYRNLWDSSIKQFRPRTTDGTWLTPYDPVEAGHRFHEGGAYQYQWLVPQDPAGLVSLMGGKRETEKRLDAFFAYDKLLPRPVPDDERRRLPRRLQPAVPVGGRSHRRVRQHAGRHLTIKAPGTSDTQRSVRQAKFGGKDLRATWLDWDAVAKGGTLAFDMTGTPSAWGQGQGRGAAVREPRGGRFPSAPRRVAAHRFRRPADVGHSTERPAEAGRAGPVPRRAAGRCRRASAQRLDREDLEALLPHVPSAPGPADRVGGRERVPPRTSMPRRQCVPWACRTILACRSTRSPSGRTASAPRPSLLGRRVARWRRDRTGHAATRRRADTGRPPRSPRGARSYQAARSSSYRHPLRRRSPRTVD
jgi:hypothetical protein